MTDPEPPRSDHQSSGRIVRTATEARQGEIVLGRRGRWVWIGSLAVLAILLLAFGLWR